MMDKEKFSELAVEGYTVVPLKQKIQTQYQDPISLFKKVRSIKDSFLLESVEGGDQWAQYSIIGFDCSDSIQVHHDEIKIIEEGRTKKVTSSKPLDVIADQIKKQKALKEKDMPRFYGGYVGFFAYESSKYAEKKIFDLSDKPSKFDEHMPEIYLIKAEKLIVFDNFSKTVEVIVNVNPQQKKYEDALKDLEQLTELLNEEDQQSFQELKEVKNNFAFSSNFTKEDYLSSVEKIKSYIKAGDVMQVVLAQDFFAEFKHDPLELYRAIRKLNPSPYMYYLNFGDCNIVGASPEILVRLQDEEVTVRPIAGTIKRGSSEEEDKILAEKLINDPKEIAEHLMLIDLGRNDVGKVAQFGSVKVTEKMIIEKFSHVMHITSNVVGRLKDELTYLDAMKASLPAGTLSGAPKIRAMEIIHELEPSSRGIYGGAVGYISWDGNMDTAIAIRTAVIKDGLIHVGAGAGVVADSVPENEWQECVQKSKVFADAMEMLD